LFGKTFSIILVIRDVISIEDHNVSKFITVFYYAVTGAHIISDRICKIM